MNQYEERQKARKERLLAKAAQCRETAGEKWDKSGKLLPWGGEPIKVGHHSEQRHRNAQKKSHKLASQAVQLHEKAKYYEQKAAGVGKGGVSSDDPEATMKLQQKLEKLQGLREEMKKANREIRKKGATPETVAKALGWKLETALKAMEPDFAGRLGFAAYELQNLGAKIRNTQKRLDQLTAQAQEPEREDLEGEGWRVEEDKGANRVRFYFDTKPDKETCRYMRAMGFRFSRQNMAWQRHLNAAGRYACQQAAQKLFGAEFDGA